METKYHFVQKYVQNDILKILFVKSSENFADVFTKNVSAPILKNLTDYLCLAYSMGTGWGVVEQEVCSPTLLHFKNY